jgi:hypothetical protein
MAHIWCAGISAGLVLLVPFGLAAMLWIPQQWQKLMNILTLACSGIAAILQFVPNVQRVRERALLLRRMYHDIELAVAKYESGALTREQLIEVLATVEKQHSEEAAP